MALGTSGSSGSVVSLGLHLTPSIMCNSAHDGGKKRRLRGTNLAVRVASTVLQERTNGGLLSLVTRLYQSTSLLPMRWCPLTDQVQVMGTSHLFGDESMGFPKETKILLSEDGGSDATLENNRCCEFLEHLLRADCCALDPQ